MKKRNWNMFLRKLTLVFSCCAALIMFLYGLGEGARILSDGAFVLQGSRVSSAMQTEITKIKKAKGSTKFIDIITADEKQKINTLIADGTLSEVNMPTFIARFLRAPNRATAFEQARDSTFGAEVARNNLVIVEFLLFIIFYTAIGFFATWGVYYMLYGLYQWLWEST